MIAEWLKELRKGFRVNKALEILDRGSKLFVSLTEEQKASMFMVLTPEQMTLAMELKELWTKFMEGRE